MQFLHGPGIDRPQQAHVTMPHMDTRWLQDFVTLAETRNFTRAAARRNTSQAAFSRRIQSLEAWAGTVLIDRSNFPPSLTEAGEQFRGHAIELLARLADAKGDLDGRPVFGRDHVRIALPYVLSTSLFPGWWQGWASGRPLSCALIHGNIHDLVVALVSGAADLMICHDTPEQPVHVDPAEFERMVLAEDILQPYGSRALLAGGRFSFPGVEGKPVPILSYTAGVYFARLVQVAIENAPVRLHAAQMAESDMADVLHGLAMAGQGIAWLPRSTVEAHGDALVPLGGKAFQLPLSVVAFRPKTARRRAVLDLWARMAR